MLKWAGGVYRGIGSLGDFDSGVRVILRAVPLLGAAAGALVTWGQAPVYLVVGAAILGAGVGSGVTLAAVGVLSRRRGQQQGALGGTLAPSGELTLRKIPGPRSLGSGFSQFRTLGRGVRIVETGYRPSRLLVEVMLPGAKPVDVREDALPVDVPVPDRWLFRRRLTVTKFSGAGIVVDEGDVRGVAVRMWPMEGQELG